MSAKMLFAEICANRQQAKKVVLHDFGFVQFFAHLTENPICANGFFLGQQNMPALPAAPQKAIGAYRFAGI
jgi:hypothetical protein